MISDDLVLDHFSVLREEALQFIFGYRERDLMKRENNNMRSSGSDDESGGLDGMLTGRVGWSWRESYNFSSIVVRFLTNLPPGPQPTMDWT